MRYPSERTQKRLRAISNAIEDFVDQRGTIGSVDEVRAAVLRTYPDAKESEFRTALHRLHYFVSG